MPYRRRVSAAAVTLHFLPSLMYQLYSFSFFLHQNMEKIWMKQQQQQR